MPKAGEISKRRSGSRLAYAKALTGLAQAVGKPPAWDSGIERGEILPALLQRLHLAQALGINAASNFPEDEED
jgi:transcriptional regulator with XRE-family HTH domain